MAQVSEITQQSQVETVLRDGVEALGQRQKITFQAYSRVVLPLDGYVFWKPTTTLSVTGSLHYSQHFEQNEDETVGLADVIFTAEEKVTEFSADPPSTIYVATVGDFRFAFAQQRGYYSTANLWHYAGRSIYPALASQLLDRPGMIDPKRAIVSNSLPLWLALSSYKPFYGFTPNVRLYPSFLVEPNLVPPYGAVHIEGTFAMTSAPYIDSNSSSWQLMREIVRITLYGLQSDESIDFLNSVLQYSRDTDNFGVMSMPRIVDGKRPQTELQAIAMQKTLELEVSYYQTRVNDVARQLILSAVPKIVLNG